jgi:predicted GIY-YIG superfamily endonuclease
MNYNMERETVIYALVDSQGRIGYVGSTQVNAKTRYWEHRSRARSGHTAPVYEWIREVGVDSFTYVELEKLEAGSDVSILEAQWIKKLIDEGHPLQNQIARDGVPNSNGERMKEILSASRKGKPTWIKGKRGEEAGWTEERRKQQALRFAEALRKK